MGIVTRTEPNEGETQHNTIIVNQKGDNIVKSPMVSSPIPPRKKSLPAKKWYAEARKWDNIKSRKSVGQRNIRREENLNSLIDLGGEPDLSEFVQLNESSSSFSILFMEQEKMRLWNDFINWSEDDQDRLLHSSQTSPWPRFHDNLDGDSDDSQLDIEVIEYLREGSGDSWQLIDDNRAVHPSFSAKECFQKIDHNLKCVLKKRHLPLGKLLAIEKEVTHFFVEWPTSVYVSRLQSSYERMLLHCLCQYLDLKSHSFDTADGIRQTEVENKYRTFLPPEVSLTEYLEDKRH